MGEPKSNKPQVLQFVPTDFHVDPLCLIWAIRGIATTLDQADITRARGAEAERISELTAAAAILSNQLCRMAEYPETRSRAATIERATAA